MSENSLIEKVDIPDMGGMFASGEAYATGMKFAKSFSESTIVPKEFQGNVANCVIAVDMAMRTKFNPMTVMQNLYTVNGRPAWSSQFIIAVINQSGRFKSKLKFNLQGQGDTLSCYASAVDLNGEEINGTKITMDMAKAEGWTTKAGSKWRTMPEQMIKYRAASFFGREHCPDLLMGIGADEEVSVSEPIHINPTSVRDARPALESTFDFDTEEGEEVGAKQQELF